MGGATICNLYIKTHTCPAGRVIPRTLLDIQHSPAKMSRLYISAFLLFALVVSAHSAPRGHYKKKKVEKKVEVSAPSVNQKVAETAATNRRLKEVEFLRDLIDFMVKAEEPENKDSYMMLVDNDKIKVFPQKYSMCDDNPCGFDIRVYASNGAPGDQKVIHSYVNADPLVLTAASSGTFAVQTCMIDNNGNTVTGPTTGCDCRKCDMGQGGSCSGAVSVQVTTPGSNQDLGKCSTSLNFS